MQQLYAKWRARFDATVVGLAWKRYSDNRGNLLAAGVTYYAFLSIFPLMALAFTVFGILLRGHPSWLDTIRTTINNALPGFIQDADGKNGVIPIGLPAGETLATVGIIGVVVLLWAGLGWLSALRGGVRAAFGVEGSPGNAVTAKLRDFGVLIVIGVAIIVSAAVATVANTAASWLADAVKLGNHDWLVTVVGIVVQTLINALIVALVLRVLSGVKLPWQGIRNGAIAGGLGLTVLQIFGARLIAGTSGNPVFGSIAIVAGLLVFLNFVSRVILISASWAANDLTPRAAVVPLDPTSTTDPAVGSGSTAAARPTGATSGPGARPLVGFRERTDAGLPTFGQRAADRTTVAAGAVLGAFGVIALGSAARGIRALFRRP